MKQMLTLCAIAMDTKDLHVHVYTYYTKGSLSSYILRTSTVACREDTLVALTRCTILIVLRFPNYTICRRFSAATGLTVRSGWPFTKKASRCSTRPPWVPSLLTTTERSQRLAARKTVSSSWWSLLGQTRKKRLTGWQEGR